MWYILVRILESDKHSLFVEGFDSSERVKGPWQCFQELRWVMMRAEVLASPRQHVTLDVFYLSLETCFVPNMIVFSNKVSNDEICQPSRTFRDRGVFPAQTLNRW